MLKKIKNKLKKTESTIKSNKTLDFKDFVVFNLQKYERIKNILFILLQDIHMFWGNCSKVDHQVWDKLNEELKEFTEEKVATYDQGCINREKDKLIRRLFILELMRQQKDYLEKNSKS